MENMDDSLSPQQFMDNLTDEFARSKQKATISIDLMSKKELKRMLKIFVGVYGNEIKMTEKEQDNLENLKLAMENFMSIMQAEGELPE